jgi:ribose 5-phosphate isomerase A
MPSDRRSGASASWNAQNTIKTDDAATAKGVSDDLKRNVGYAGADMVKDGMIVGLGTGSTAKYAIERLGQRVKEGLKLKGIPTSIESERLARSLGIPITTLELDPEIDITIDGADEVDPDFNLVKGLGGALLREKMIAYVTKCEVIVVDSSKMVEKLCSRAPLPVEVVKFEHVHTSRLLKKLGCTPVLRRMKDNSEPFVTDNGNFIYDCKFQPCSGPRQLNECIRNIPGVVDNGLFIDLADVVICASEKGVEIKRKKE